MDTTLTAALLGLLEGLTEFLPVSSTGHLLLAGHFLGFESKGKTFEVVIQLGAILALASVYAAMVTRLVLRARHEDAARRSIMSVLLAFLPAAVIGLLAHDFIKDVLFETPILIAVMLFLPAGPAFDAAQTATRLAPAILGLARAWTPTTQQTRH